MKFRLIVVLNLMLLAGFLAGAVLTQSAAAAAADTEDVIYLTDGRVLHGRIVSQSAGEVEFEWFDRRATSVSKIKLTLDMTKVLRIERDVAVASSAPAPKPATSSPASAESAPVAGSGADSSSSPESAPANSDLPKIYVVPMRGQMGTDVHPDMYKLVMADIRQVKPAAIVITIDCKDVADRIYTEWGKEEQSYDDSLALDSYRRLMDIFHKELTDIPQYVWVHDSYGISSVIAMSWKSIYMKPHARLGGLAKSAVNFLRVKSDFNTFGKYREAYMAWLKGFVEFSGRDLVLVDAMVRPEFELSASFKGRSVKWFPTTDGDYVVDRNKEDTADFTARAAENVLLSDGTAEFFDDLAFLIGYREYTLVDANAEKIVKTYIDDWHRVFERAKTDLEEYIKYRGWAKGEDTVKYLGKAKAALVDMVAGMNRYEPVMVRMGRDYGVTVIDAQIRIEQINETIRALKNQKGGKGGGGGGSGGGGVGGGGRP